MKLSRALSDLVKYTKSVGIHDVETESRLNWKSAENNCYTKKRKGFCSYLSSYVPKTLDHFSKLFNEIQVIPGHSLYPASFPAITPPIRTVILLYY